MAECAHHPGVMAIASCSACGRSFCPDCLIYIQGRALCADCKGGVVHSLKRGGLEGAQHAGFWIRLVAVIIDGALIWVVNMGVMVVFMVLGFAVMAGAAAGGGPASKAAPFAMGLANNLAQLLGMLIAAVYESVMVGRYGATLGKMAVGVRVIRDDGSPVGYSLAILRYICKILSYIICCIGFFMVGFHEKKKGLHDILCGTLVVMKPSAGQAAPYSPPAPQSGIGPAPPVISQQKPPPQPAQPAQPDMPPPFPPASREPLEPDGR